MTIDCMVEALIADLRAEFEFTDRKTVPMDLLRLDALCTRFRVRLQTALISEARSTDDECQRIGVLKAGDGGW